MLLNKYKCIIYRCLPNTENQVSKPKQYSSYNWGITVTGNYKRFNNLLQ